MELTISVSETLCCRRRTHPAMFHNWDPRNTTVRDTYNRHERVCLAMRLRTLSQVATIAQRTCRLLHLQHDSELLVSVPTRKT
jgi:hypothetical protein